MSKAQIEELVGQAIFPWDHIEGKFSQLKDKFEQMEATEIGFEVK